jgi:beta-lactam-binding protein with PASTA domain
MSRNKNTRIFDYFWLMPFFVFFSVYFMLNIWFRSGTLSMPNLMGKNLIDATKICSASQLYIQITQIKQDTELPQSTVIHQIPAPEKTIKERQTVYLAITEKPAFKTTPHCIGLSRNQIKQNLTPLQLKPKFYEITYPYPIDHCFCQWPAPNSPIKTKTVVCYIAKETEKQCIWPDFTNKTLNEVKQQLEQYDIKIKTDTIPNNKYTYYVIDQQPKAGSIIDISHPEQITTYFKINRKNISR